MAKVFSEKDNNTRVSLKPGETVEIVLPGNPTTGYTWTRDGYFEAEQANNLSCEKLAIHKGYGQDAAPAGMCGVGGNFKFEVSPKQVGQHKLELVYARPWEGANSAARKFCIDVDCQS